MKKIISLALASGILFVGIQTMNAGPNEKQLLEAAETDCLEDAENAMNNGASNANDALGVAQYYNASEVANFLQELAAEERADEDNDLVEEAMKKSPRAERAARRAGVYPH